jgi:hypothetical protein
MSGSGDTRCLHEEFSRDGGSTSLGREVAACQGTAQDFGLRRVGKDRFDRCRPDVPRLAWFPPERTSRPSSVCDRGNGDPKGQMEPTAGYGSERSTAPVGPVDVVAIAGAGQNNPASRTPGFRTKVNRLVTRLNWPLMRRCGYLPDGETA